MENIIKEYKTKVDLQKLNEKEKKDLKLIFEQIEEMLNSERKVEGKFKIPDEILLDLAKEIASKFNPNREMLRFWKSELNSIIKIDGKIDEKLGNKLYEIYNNPNVSIGIHGAYHSEDVDVSDNNSYFIEGLKCKYRDAKRTIAFQDRGKIHGHGNISFIDLLTYNYGKQQEWMTCEWKDKEDGSREFQKYVGKDGRIVVQDNYIVVIPKNMRTTEVVIDGKIDTKFILGTFRNSKWNEGYIERGNWDSFVRNSRFNLREIESLNEEYKTISQEEVTTDKLGRETIEEQQSQRCVEDKIRLRAIIGKLMSKIRENRENSYRGE